MRKKDNVWLFVILIPIILVVALVEKIGFPLFILILAAIIVGIIWYSDKKRKEKIAYLTNKYKNKDIVDRIMSHSIWQGQTAEQLVDSLKNPLDIEENILKTKKREVWKYHCDGINRYKLRITLENDKVIGWKQR